MNNKRKMKKKNNNIGLTKVEATELRFPFCHFRNYNARLTLVQFYFPSFNLNHPQLTVVWEKKYIFGGWGWGDGGTRLRI
jgi:hypothetical protein